MTAVANRVLDTNVLIKLWHGKMPGPNAIRVTTEETARKVAAMYLRAHPDDAILTPIKIEFLGGTRDRDELKLADLFLSQFVTLDEGRIFPVDWQEAERYARRVPFTGRSRGLVDCLIRAICDRLHADLHTDDSGMPAR